MPYTMVVERQIQPVEARFHSSGFVVRSPIDDTGKAGMNDGARAHQTRFKRNDENTAFEAVIAQTVPAERMAMISAWADGSDRVMG